MSFARPDQANIARAAQYIRAGGLVVMPTETVYGLAADALNPEAVREIFAAKGRPPENPLIVHVASPNDMWTLAEEVPETAVHLAELFWPGPLTMVLRKSDLVPDVITAGLGTVALRLPNHTVALELIRASGTCLAAPSANRFTSLPPTRAEHLDPAIVGAAEMVLDAGPCRVGVESTVLDLTGGRPAILRPGAISRKQLEQLLGYPLGSAPPGARRSPGLYPRHYAPKASVRLVETAGQGAAALVLGRKTGDRQISMPSEPGAYAARLYAALHELDARNPMEIEVEVPPHSPEWEAVMDRLKKASA